METHKEKNKRVLAKKAPIYDLKQIEERSPRENAKPKMGVGGGVWGSQGDFLKEPSSL